MIYKLALLPGLFITMEIEGHIECIALCENCYMFHVHMHA